MCTHFTGALLFPACLFALLLGGRIDGGRRVALETLKWEGKKPKTIKEKPRHILSAFEQPLCDIYGNTALSRCPPLLGKLFWFLPSIRLFAPLSLFFLIV